MMKKHKKTWIMLLSIDIAIVVIAFICWYMLDLSHDRIAMMTGKIIEITDDDFYPLGIYIENQEKTRICRLECDLDELSDRFSENFQLDDEIWILYSHSSKLLRPETVHPIYNKNGRRLRYISSCK